MEACGDTLADLCELVLDRHESRRADCTAGLYVMLAGLAGPEDVDEKDDFPDAIPPGNRVSSAGDMGKGLDAEEPACVDDGEAKGETPYEAALSGLCDLCWWAGAEARGLKGSVPGCGRYAMGGGCGGGGMAAMIGRARGRRR